MIPLRKIFETKEKGIIVSIFERDKFKQKNIYTQWRSTSKDLEVAN